MLDILEKVELSKTYYSYDDKGVYVGSGVQDINPVYLDYVRNHGIADDMGVLRAYYPIPNSTQEEPPLIVEEGKVAVWNGTKWTLESDNRGKVIWLWDEDSKSWIETKGGIGELPMGARLSKPEIYETPDGIDIELLRNYRKQELIELYDLSKLVTYNNKEISLNTLNSQTINTTMVNNYNSRSSQPLLLHLTNGDLLIENSSQLSKLQEVYNTKQIELYRKNEKQLEFLLSATVDELLKFQPSF